MVCCSLLGLMYTNKEKNTLAVTFLKSDSAAAKSARVRLVKQSLIIPRLFEASLQAYGRELGS